MDQTTARILIKSLISRLVEAGNDQWQLQGTVTSLERQALGQLVEDHVPDTNKNNLGISLSESSDSRLEESELNPVPAPGTEPGSKIEDQGGIDETEIQMAHPAEEQEQEQIATVESLEGESGSVSERDSLLDEKLSDFVLPDKLENIRAVLISVLGDDATLSQLIEIGDWDLLAKPGLGKGKLRKSRILQRDILDGKYGTAISLDDDIPEESISNPEHESLLVIRLADFILPSKLDTIKNVLLSALGDDATLFQLVETSDLELLKKPRLGKGKLKKSRALQRDLLDGKYRTASDSNGDASSNCVFDGLDDVPLDELEQVLLEDIEQFVDQLNEKSQFIFVNRNGWKTPSITLEEVGSTLPGGSVTRERIRQLQKKLDQDLMGTLRVSPRTLWINVKSNLSLWGEPLFPELRKRFLDAKDFYHFLELCCDVKDGRILSVTQPDISNVILDEFWTESISPLHYSKLVDYLQSEHGFEHAVAENALIRLKERGVLKISDEQIVPMQLSKPLAIAHVLSLSPQALSWKTIHEKANNLGISRTPFLLDRQDTSLGTAVDNGWIYQSGQGEYQSISQLELSDQDIESTLIKVKICLEEEKRGGRNAINLAVDFYDRERQSLDYFTVRHIIRAYGERQSIFFSGKSGTDTISLDSEFSLASQEKAIVQSFVKAGGPLTKQDIARTIRSQSINHAAFYLDLLIKAEKIVRISAIEYALTSKAFETAKIPEIVKSAATFLAGESRVVEGEVLQRHLNREFDLEQNKYYYLSLLRIHAAQLGYDWHYSYNLVSNTPLAFGSVAELYRQVVEEGEGAQDNQEIIRRMSQRLRADEHYLTNAIYANRPKATE